ncbi:glycoside hydrolase family 13 protein [Limoniibacter endophyticus]|uniref:Glucan 1,6-alpha-glucosidase n=1 Tax=Limoniibacter endophyticus TaxID=1565040 RepID=A0A8J3DKN2_9HYPH|nr:alpha-glucosidase [Limoniibacter endophyticus]GHC77556.1 glucan 1,6-alpha-glucosidase [Limoniibacter endophyticus]
MSESRSEKNWWHSATVYQIYPRSFFDSNGDGIGDLRGITLHLDYLKKLGIGLIWLSPIFKSPMDDNGYDISDYQDIAAEFGTLRDFEELLEEARKRDIGILLDLVVNHTSDEHPWFMEARKSEDNPFRNFYIWRDPDQDGGPPNSLQSSFGGPAWSYEPATGQYYFHQFSRRQPDLNWDNPEVRCEIYNMMNWWLDKGIAGFRMDVIDRIAKEVDSEITADGPRLHEYLQEMHRETLAERNVLTVGEAWSATPGSALLYCGEDRNELSMVFQFEHVTQQWDQLYGKWRSKPFDLVALKSVLGKWQHALANDGWNSLFWGNHDLPRVVSNYGDTAGYHRESATMLATALHLLKGTPFIYQGEEIGMTNAVFQRIEQYRDVETLNMHRLHIEAGLSVEEFIAGANRNSRDNARTPMQWNSAPHGGFTTGTPWIESNPNYPQINVNQNLRDDRSIWNHYRRLIALRKSEPVIVYGTYQGYFDQHPNLYVYTRTLGTRRVVIIANFTAESVTFTVPNELRGRGRCLISNYENIKELESGVTMRPFEAFAVLQQIERSSSC